MNESNMSNINKNDHQISEDIEFLFELCRDLIRMLKRRSQHQEILINREKIA
jgi:hypothetical protein